MTPFYDYEDAEYVLVQRGLWEAVQKIEKGKVNPLLGLQREYGGTPFGVDMTPFYVRDYAARKYAWAVPDEEALECIIECGPVVEVGAGRGYWANLIRQGGGDIIACDETLPHESFTEVLQADAAAFAKEHSDRTLLMVWPPYDEPMATEALAAYKAAGGKRLIYVGEGVMGCTGDDAFHYALPTDTRRVFIPTWAGIHDDLRVCDL